MKAAAESILAGVGELEASIAGASKGAGVGEKRKRVTKPKDPLAPKRPITDFFLFGQKLRKDAPEGTKLKNTDIALAWGALPPGEKDAYARKAQSLKEKYNEEKAKYEAGKVSSSAASAASAAASAVAEEEDSVSTPSLPLSLSPPPSH
jgi:hypothetical protein